MENFTKEAKKAMIDLEITLDEIAERMGVSKTYVSDLINGHRSAEKRLDELKKILELEDGSNEI